MAGRKTERIGVKVNSYRGFKIWYDEGDDKFYTDLNDNSYTEKLRRVKRTGLKGIKQEINDHIKKNLQFKPFYFIEKNYGGQPQKKKVISIRKDGALLVQSDSERRDWLKVNKDRNGKINPASDYNQMCVYDDNAEVIIANIAILEAEKDSLDKKISKLNNSLEPLDLSFIKPYIIENSDE